MRRASASRADEARRTAYASRASPPESIRTTSVPARYSPSSDRRDDRDARPAGPSRTRPRTSRTSKPETRAIRRRGPGRRAAAVGGADRTRAGYRGEPPPVRWTAMARSAPAAMTVWVRPAGGSEFGAEEGSATNTLGVVGTSVNWRLYPIPFPLPPVLQRPEAPPVPCPRDGVGDGLTAGGKPATRPPPGVRRRPAGMLGVRTWGRRGVGVGYSVGRCRGRLGPGSVVCDRCLGEGFGPHCGCRGKLAANGRGKAAGVPVATFRRAGNRPSA